MFDFDKSDAELEQDALNAQNEEKRERRFKIGLFIGLGILVVIGLLGDTREPRKATWSLAFVQR